MVNKVLSFFVICLYALGTIGGIGYTIYNKAYPIAVGVAATGWMAWWGTSGKVYPLVPKQMFKIVHTMQIVIVSNNMTSSGIDTFLKTTYKVGGTIFYNLEDAIMQSYREQQGTSGSASIEVEQHYLY